MRSLAILSMVFITLLLFAFISYMYYSYRTKINYANQQLPIDARASIVYKLLIDSGYLDIVANMTELNYANSSQFFRDLTRLIYLNRYLVKVTNQYASYVKVYMNGTLIFDSEYNDVRQTPRLTWDINSLRYDETFRIYPYISPSGNYYKIIIVIGS